MTTEMQSPIGDHPAKFNQYILLHLDDVLMTEYIRKGHALKVFDPFAGTGLIHSLFVADRIETFGYEIEPEWAQLHPRTTCGNSLNVEVDPWTFDVICTSPTYGNRMADHHNAQDSSKRMTYTHRLGRPLHEANTGQMHWGPEYRTFHDLIWREQTRILKPRGLLVLNCKDFYRTKKVRKTSVTERVEVCQWHVDTLTRMGYELEREIVVPVRGMRMGANHLKRMGHEMIYLLRRP